VWYLFNEAYNLAAPFSWGSNAGTCVGSNGLCDTNWYYVGNKIHDISVSYPSATYGLTYDPTVTSPAVFSGGGGQSKYIVNNTAWNVASCYREWDNNSGSLVYANNICGKLYDSSQNMSTYKAYTISFGSKGILANPATMISNNIFCPTSGSCTEQDMNTLGYSDGSGGKWQNLAAFAAAGYCTHCIGSDPKFSDAARLMIGESSAAIDAGWTPSNVNDVYLIFKDRYGIDISVDFNGNPRPRGYAWDIGAYEYGSSSLTIPKNLRVP
jgi:hypothetical protein